MLDVAAGFSTLAVGGLIGAGLVVYPGRTIESDVVLMASSTRRVIAKNISYEESDHHYIGAGDLHPGKEALQVTLLLGVEIAGHEYLMTPRAFCRRLR